MRCRICWPCWPRYWHFSPHMSISDFAKPSSLVLVYITVEILVAPFADTDVPGGTEAHVHLCVCMPCRILPLSSSNPRSFATSKSKIVTIPALWLGSPESRVNRVLKMVQGVAMILSTEFYLTDVPYDCYLAWELEVYLSHRFGIRWSIPRVVAEGRVINFNKFIFTTDPGSITEGSTSNYLGLVIYFLAVTSWLPLYFVKYRSFIFNPKRCLRRHNGRKGQVIRFFNSALSLKNVILLSSSQQYLIAIDCQALEMGTPEQYARNDLASTFLTKSKLMTHSGTLFDSLVKGTIWFFFHNHWGYFAPADIFMGGWDWEVSPYSYAVTLVPRGLDQRVKGSNMFQQSW